MRGRSRNKKKNLLTLMEIGTEIEMGLRQGTDVVGGEVGVCGLQEEGLSNLGSWSWSWSRSR
jgi:hypothetical protein